MVRCTFASRVLAPLSAPLLAVPLMLAGCGGFAGSAGTTPTPQISVTVTGPAATRLLDSTQFSAVVSNSTNQAVTWQVGGVTGGTAATGMISSTGLYTAPSALPAGNGVTVTAISQASASASGSVTENLLNPLPVISTAVGNSSGSTTNFLLDVQGTGYIPSSVIQVAGVPATTSFVSATELQAAVTVTAGTTAVSVSVANPAPGAAT